MNLNRLHHLLVPGAVVGVLAVATAFLWSPVRAAPPAQAPTAVSPVAAVTPETTDGVIAGQVVTGTAGADTSGFAGLSVTLYAFLNNEPEAPISTTTSAMGTFEFKGLSTSATRQYDVSVHYKGIEYFIEKPIAFQPGDSSLDVSVPVYETTNDPSKISLSRVHLIVDFQDQQFMRITELNIFSNGGDRTFIGTEPISDTERLATLRFTLPPGATNVRFEDARMQSTTVQGDGVVTDTLPVPPGGRQVLISYLLPYTRPDFTLVKPIAYNTANFNVLALDVGQKVNADGLNLSDPLTPGSGTKYLNLVGQNIQAGQNVNVQFKAIPANLPASNPSGEAAAATTPGPGLNQDLVRLGGIGLAIVAALLVIGYPLLRSQSRVNTRPSEQRPERDPLAAQRDELVESIARLDDAYEAGEMDETEYQAQRSAARAALVRVIRQQRELAQGESQ